MPKIYSSRAMTHAMSVDYPIGDPTGGAAYGEKNDPITIGFSIAGMASTYGAMAAGSIMAGVAFAGSALTLAGTLSGNKTLTKIGAIAGIAGNLGAMGAFGETVQGATWANTFGSSGATPGAAEALSSASASAGKPAMDVGVNPAANDVAALKPGQVNVLPGEAGYTPGQMDYSLGTPTDVGFTKPTISDTGLGPSANTSANYGLNGGASITKDPTFLESLKKGNILDASGKALGGTFDWIGKNPYGALALGQFAAPIADYLSGKTDAELDALKAQTGYADAKALELQTALDREKQRRSNLNAGYQNVNAGMTVNPNAMNSAAAQPQGNGIIANAVRPA